jgi:hypothetical protein
MIEMNAEWRANVGSCWACVWSVSLVESFLTEPSSCLSGPTHPETWGVLYPERANLLSLLHEKHLYS